MHLGANLLLPEGWDSPKTAPSGADVKSWRY
jgi:hypothetical protein